MSVITTQEFTYSGEDRQTLLSILQSLGGITKSNAQLQHPFGTIIVPKEYAEANPFTEGNYFHGWNVLYKLD